MIRTQKSPLAGLIGAGMLACLMLVLSLPTFAQSDNSQISGFVKDSAGAVLANAKVTVRSETKVFERTAVTNAEGYFIVPTLPPDVYSVTVEAQGFRTYKETGRKLDPNLPASIEVAMQAGQISETVSEICPACIATSMLAGRFGSSLRPVSL